MLWLAVLAAQEIPETTSDFQTTMVVWNSNPRAYYNLLNDTREN